MSLVQTINSEATPLNGQSQYSSKNGSFNIIFELTGGANQMIDLRSLRLLGNIDYLKSNGQHFNNFNQYGNNIPITGTASGGVDPAYVTAVNPFYDIDARVGASATIQSVILEDATNNVLEAIYSYPHLLSKVGPITTSKQDNLTWTGPIYGIKSGGKQLQNQTALNSTNEVSMKLYSGLLQSMPMPMSAVRGVLRLTITLNAPASVLFGGANSGANQGVGGTANPASGSFFNMNDVKLVYRTIVMDQDAPIMKSGYGFKSFSSLQSTINNSNNQNIYNPNASNAICVMTSFIRSTALNSYNANSYQSNKLVKQGATPAGEPVDIQSTNFLKNNVRFPNSFPIDERVYNQNNNGFKSYDAQRSFYYMSCLKPLDEVDKTLIQPSTEGNGSNQCGGFKEVNEPDGVPVYGVGIRYANVSLEDGTSFMNGMNFLQRIESGLNGTLPNEMFSTVLSTKKIVATPSGPLVVA